MLGKVGRLLSAGCLAMSFVFVCCHTNKNTNKYQKYKSVELGDQLVRRLLPAGCPAPEQLSVGRSAFLPLLPCFPQNLQQDLTPDLRFHIP